MGDERRMIFGKQLAGFYDLLRTRAYISTRQFSLLSAVRLVQK